MRVLLWSLSLLFLYSCTHGYEVLVIVTIPSRSHNNLGKGVVNALLKAGHKVTWATPFPPKNPTKGLTIIDCHEIIDAETVSDLFDLSKFKDFSIVKGFSTFKGNLRNGSITTFSKVKKTLMEKQFDAVVTEYFLNDAESGYAAVQQVPWITLSATPMPAILQEVMDEAHTIPTLPEMFADFPIPMNFWQRLITTTIYLGMKTMMWYDTSTSKALYEDMFSEVAKARGVPLPPFDEASRNISILLVNSHPSVTYPVSLAPNIVEIAGFHLDEEVPPLPEDLQKILDNSPQGVVYFSMGSVLRSSSISDITRKQLLKVFSKLPHTVLWKFEEPISDLPPNVHVRSWMPQRSILAHKNVRAFITHGGLLGSLEAASHGVPLVSIPVFGDQPANAARAESNGYGRTVKLDMDTLASDLEEPLRDVLYNTSYYKRAQEVAVAFNKRLVPPSKVISVYIELAIETKGAYHLRSKSQLYPWYARAMLDQVAFLFVIVIILCYIVKKTVGLIVRKICTFLCSSRNKVKVN